MLASSDDSGGGEDIRHKSRDIRIQSLSTTIFHKAERQSLGCNLGKDHDYIRVYPFSFFFSGDSLQ